MFLVHIFLKSDVKYDLKKKTMKKKIDEGDLFVLFVV